MNKNDILNIFNNEIFTEIYLETEATTRSYEKHFKRLVDMIPIKVNDKILDIGTAHGPSSLALFRKQPQIEVVAVDPSRNLLLISKAKFYGENINEFFTNYSKNGAVLSYLADQYQECSKFNNKISYVESFAEDLDDSKIGKFDHILGSLSLHWLVGPFKAFSNFYKILKKNSTVAISSSSWKYRTSDPNIDHKKRFDNSPFLKKFYKNLDSILGYKETEIIPEEDLWNLNKLTRLLNGTGFELINYFEEKKTIS